MGHQTNERPSLEPRPWRPRYSLAAVLLLMLVVSVASAAGYRFAQIVQTGRSGKFQFILFTLAAPAALVTVISLAMAVVKRWR